MFVLFSILIFSILVNLNRFLEYETKVNKFFCCCRFLYLNYFQTVISQIPSSFQIEGASLLGVNISTGDNIYKWTIWKPTALRSDTVYATVGTQNILYLINIFSFFQVSNSLSVGLSFVQLLVMMILNLLLSCKEYYGNGILVLDIVLFATSQAPLETLNVVELIGIISSKSSYNINCWAQTKYKLI